jgi:hypothetical protein
MRLHCTNPPAAGTTQCACIAPDLQYVERIAVLRECVRAARAVAPTFRHAVSKGFIPMAGRLTHV